MAKNTNEKTVALTAFRQFFYLALMMSFIFFLHFLARHYYSETFAENGVVENIQLSLLLTSGIIFTVYGCINKEYRHVSLMLASVCLLAACRELDAVLDKKIPEVSWRVGFVFPFAAVVYAWKERNNTLKPLCSFLSSPAFFMMCNAVIIILPIAQCIGHRPFVINVLGESQMREIKEFFEEATEAMGYFLILLSSFEYGIFIRKK